MELVILLILPSQFSLLKIRICTSAFQFFSRTPGDWQLENWVEPRALQSTSCRGQLQGHRVFMWPSPHKSQEKIKAKVNVTFMF